MYNGIGKVTPLDEIFLSIMAFDIHKVIEKCRYIPQYFLHSLI